METNQHQSEYAAILEERDSLLEQQSKLQAALSKMEEERDDLRRKNTNLQLNLLIPAQAGYHPAHEEVATFQLNVPPKFTRKVPGLRCDHNYICEDPSQRLHRFFSARL